MFDFDRDSVLQTLGNSGRQLDNFNGFLHDIEELRHSYEKFRFRGGAEKPSFEEVYYGAKAFIKDILPKERIREPER